MSAWMLYAIAVSAFFAAAAWAADRALGLYHRPTRVPWILALVASVAVPVVSALVPASSAAVPPGAQPIIVTGVQAIERVGAATVSLDVVLGVSWIVISAVMLAWLAWSYLRLRREQSQWIRTVVDGTPVFVSSDVGPAVVDPIAGSIVVPRWLLDVTPAERRLALDHERSHVCAGDARLVWLGMLLVVAMPWNPVLWWQLHRLRAAVELDCDRRVLASGAAASAYATLLLSMGEGRGASLLRPALIEPQSLLGWRISAMIEKRIRARLARTVVYGALAVGLFFVACDAPAPQHPGEVPLDEGPTVESFDPAARWDPAAYDGAIAESAVDESPEKVSCPPLDYPRMLQQAGIEGSVRARFVVGVDGSVLPNSVVIVKSDHRAFEGPVKDMITRCRFTPGRVNGSAVKVDVEMPVNFTLQHSGGESASSGNAGGIRITGTAIERTGLGVRCDRNCSVIADPARQPLFVVDGVIMDQTPNVETMNVHTIEVIKGGSAQARYGERAANGVIVITTKKN